MKVLRASLATLVLGTAYALTAPGIQADEGENVDKNKPNKPVPAQNNGLPQPPPLPQAAQNDEPIRDRHASMLQRAIFQFTQAFGGEANVDPRIKGLQKDHEIKLDALQALAKEEPSKLAQAISDMHSFYTEKFGDNSSEWGKNRQTRNYLLATAGDSYGKLFTRCLELTASDNEDEHKAGLDSIKALREFLPWPTLSRGELPIEEVVNAKKHLEPYFQKRFSGVVDEPGKLARMLEEGVVLLGFVNMHGDNNTCQNTFLSWFDTNLANSVASDAPNPAVAVAFNSAMDEMMSAPASYLPNLFYPQYYDLHAKQLSSIASNYPTLIKMGGNSPDALWVGLDMVQELESLCTSQRKREYPESYALYSKGLIELFDYVTKTVPELPKSDKQDKLEHRMLLLPALHASYTRTTRERKNEYLTILGNNYFSREGYVGDSERLTLYIEQVSRQVRWKSNASSYPNYVFMYLVDNNPEFFQKGVEGLFHRLDSTRDRAQRTNIIQALGESYRLFSKFADAKSVDAKDVEFYDLASKVDTWSREHVIDPIAGRFVSLAGSETVSAQIARQNLDIGDESWREMNRWVPVMSESSPEFRTKLGVAVTNRLQSDTNPYSRARAFEALRLSWQHTGGTRSIMETLPLVANESSYHGIEEAGHLLADAIYFENENIIYHVTTEPGEEDTSKPEDWGAVPAPKVTTVVLYVTSNEFSQRLMDYTDRKIKFDALSIPIDNRELTPAQSMITNCISVLHGDLKLIKKLTGREFNPPTFVKTYKANGETVVIRVTPGDKASREAERALTKQGARLISDEVDRSKQDPGDGPALRQAMHNAFLTLAYSAARSYSYDPNVHPLPPGPSDETEAPYDQMYKEAIIKYLEKNLYHSVFYDPDPVHWGEKAAALIELYHSCEEDPFKREKFVRSKVDDLRGFFFEKERGNQGIVGEAMPVFENLEESILQDLAWRKRVPIKDLKYSRSVQDKYRDELNKIRRDMIDLRTSFAYGVLGSSGHAELSMYIDYLMGTGRLADAGRFEGLGFYESDVEDALKRLNDSLAELN